MKLTTYHSDLGQGGCLTDAILIFRQLQEKYLAKKEDQSCG